MPDPHVGYVYFAYAEAVNLVKIGYSRGYPEHRFKQFSTFSPVLLTRLGYLRGPMAVERELHQKFRHLRHHGEWFLYAADLREFVKSETLVWHDLEAAEALGIPTPIADWATSSLFSGLGGNGSGWGN